MITGKSLIRAFVVILGATMFIMPLVACNKTSSATSKIVDAGAAWTVTKTTTLAKLTVAEGATVTAPEGRSLTMTVDSVETPIAAGTYTGKVVLTPTEDIPVTVTGMASKTYHYRTAVYVANGIYVPAKSVGSAVAAGAVTDTAATDVKITSVGENFNGIIVTGDTKSTYSIINPDINFTGNGTNDFAGYGAAIMTEGKAEVTIEKAKINSTGAVRTAVFVGGDSITNINNSEIEVHNGTLPKDYSWTSISELFMFVMSARAAVVKKGM